jgi:hypothetical protein
VSGSDGDRDGDGNPTDATFRVDDPARERLLSDLHELDEAADGTGGSRERVGHTGDDEATVRAIEPIVAWLKGWRETVSVDDWLDLLAHVPRRYHLRVSGGADGAGDGEGPPTTYVRYDGEYGWRLLRRTEGDLAGPTTVPRATVASRLRGRVVEPDVIDALDPAVRGRFVLPD